MDLAERMYEAYRRSLARVGVIVPLWHSAGEDEREAWHEAEAEAFKEVAACL